MKIFSLCILLFIINFLNVSAQSISSTCSGANSITFLTPTPHFTVSGSPGSPALTECTSSAITKEGWFYFTAQGTNNIITFSNTGTQTGYIFIYKGANCSSLVYDTCSLAEPGNVCLINLKTTNAARYYIRVADTSASGNVKGYINIIKNNATFAKLCTPDQTPFSTGSVDAGEGKFDDIMKVGWNMDYSSQYYLSMGYIKVNTSDLPKTGINISSIHLLTTPKYIFSDPDAGFDILGSQLVVGKMPYGNHDPVTAPYDSLFTTTDWIFGTNMYTLTPASLAIANMSIDKTYCYTLNALANYYFTNEYIQDWWSLNLMVYDSFGFGLGYVDYYGWNSLYPPYIVVTYDKPCVVANFTTQPVSPAPQCSPASANFNVSAEGDATIKYQWQVYNGSWVNISDGGSNPTYSGSTSTTLSVTGATTTLQYQCIAINCSGKNTASDIATITIKTIPSITANPVSETKCTGQSSAFSVNATGTATLSYQWLKTVNSQQSTVNGATTSQYSILSSQLSDEGAYSCIITNSCGSVTSGSAILTVNFTPISNDPVSADKCTGESINFTIDATGKPAPAYQWKKTVSGQQSTVNGATLNTYTINSITTNDAGNYSCVISNSCGSITTNQAVLTVKSPPISTDPQSLIKCSNQSASFTITAYGTNPLSYQWLKTVNSQQSTVDGATISQFLILSSQLSDEGSYSCVVSNICGSITTNPATLTVNSAPLSSDPISITKCTGESAVFSIEVSAKPSPTYQWKKNNVNINNATNSQFSILSSQLSDAGNYICAISNTCGSITTNGATLTIHTAPISTDPESDTKCAGDIVLLTVSASGNPTPTYQWKKDDVNINNATKNTYYVPYGAPSDSGIYTCIVSNSCGSLTTNQATIIINTPPVSSDPVSETKCVGQSVAFSVTASGEPAPAYQWKKNNNNINNATNSQFSVLNTQLSDAANYTCVVSNSCGSVTTNPAILVVNTLPSIDIQPVDITKTEPESATFTITASGSGLSYQWQQDDINLTNTGVYSNTDRSNLKISDITGLNGKRYRCLVSGYCSPEAISDYALLTVIVPCTAPVISQQPSSLERCIGTKAIFTIMSDGTQPFSYQWNKDNSSISGATNSQFSVLSSQFSDAGSYTCIVSNSCGSVTSSAVSLTLASNPVISYFSPSKTKCLNDSAVFNIIASGNLLHYEWSKDGITISGETSSKFQVQSLTLSHGGIYSCVVTNICGNTSANSTLTVLAAPQILNTISNITQCEGTSTTFSVTATGQDISYQWNKNGEDIQGATTSNLKLETLNINDAGVYSCVVSNSCEAKNLKPFLLTVNQKPIINTAPITETKNIGDIVTYNLTPAGGAPYSYQWLKNSETIAGQTQSLYVLEITSCNDAAEYTCSITNACGNSVVKIATIIISACNGYSLDGFVLYDKKAVTPIKNITVYLENTEGIKIDSTISDINGAYKFENIPDGSYTLSALNSIFSPFWGGSNPVDALYVNRSYLGFYTFVNTLREKAANVNNDKTINPVDALLINKRYIGTITKFSIPDWLFDKPSITISGADLTQDIRAICAGDVDASYPKKYKKKIVASSE